MDRLADKPAQQHLQLRQDIVELQRLRPQRLPARERQQLANQARRPVGVLLDLHDVLKGRIRRPVIGEQQIGVTDDGGQHIVEIVRDPACELTDRLHFLALREVLLQRALLGRIESEHDRTRALVTAGVGGGDEQAGRARRLSCLQRYVERSNFAPTRGGGGNRLAQRGMVALRHEGEDRQLSSGRRRTSGRPGLVARKRRWTAAACRRRRLARSRPAWS